MKQFLSANLILLVVLTAFAMPMSVRASEGGDGHGLEAEVGNYHVVLDSQNEWVKGENVLLVTITDHMGMPLSGADVEILVTPQKGGHNSSETGTHNSVQEDAMPGMDMGAGQSDHAAMPGMDMGNNPSPSTGHDQMNTPGAASSDHAEDSRSPIPMTETEHGVYLAQTHLETSGEYDVHVMFHVNGEMLQADFVVKVTGSSSKLAVIWSYLAINAAIIAVAGVLKKQNSITVKGGN